ncbi:2049_t:CDS:2 [Ambispora gerdemannii]|uniref:2049_t:CDS:1 n=1 Tax=Ambispora gerdemannii TaxID=144530 RepID=A0A9N9CG38_9GLOM|nr:2049_t:CDS:2 [Ambispora gerdemannii]
MLPNDVNSSARFLTAAFIPILYLNSINTLDEFVNRQIVLVSAFVLAYSNVPLSTITSNNEPSEIIAGKFAFQVDGFNLARILSFLEHWPQAYELDCE